MKRTLKNILVFAILALSVSSMVLTMNQIRRRENLFDLFRYVLSEPGQSESVSSDSSADSSSSGEQSSSESEKSAASDESTDSSADASKDESALESSDTVWQNPDENLQSSENMNSDAIDDQSMEEPAETDEISSALPDQSEALSESGENDLQDQTSAPEETESEQPAKMEQTDSSEADQQEYFARLKIYPILPDTENEDGQSDAASSDASSVSSDTSSQSDTKSGSDESISSSDSNQTDASARSASTVSIDTPVLGWQEYVIFGVESLIFALALIYLLMSGFNKKTFRQTLKNADKWLIWLLSSVIVTACVLYADIFITEKYFMAPVQALKTSKDGTLSYTGTIHTDFDTVLESGNYEASAADSNVVLVTDASASLNDSQIDKSGDASSPEDPNALNAAVLSLNGSRVSLKNDEISTDGQGAPALAALCDLPEDPAQIGADALTITTQKPYSPGAAAIDCAVLELSETEINTFDTFSPAVLSTSSAGSLILNGGNYTTYGSSSPVLHAKGTLEASNLTMAAQVSEGLVLNGANAVLTNCSLSDSNTIPSEPLTSSVNMVLTGEGKDQSKTKLTLKDSSVTTGNGDTFLITGTSASIILVRSTIDTLDPAGALMRIAKSGLSETGASANIDFDEQKTFGNIIVDSDSSLNLNLKHGSSWEGAINPDNSASHISLKLDGSSSIKLTGDSYISTLEDENELLDNIDCNGFTLYVNDTAYN